MGVGVCLLPALLSKHCVIQASSKEQPGSGSARAQTRGELGTWEERAAERVAGGPGAGYGRCSDAGGGDSGEQCVQRIS